MNTEKPIIALSRLSIDNVFSVLNHLIKHFSPEYKFQQYSMKTHIPLFINKEKI
ncbi:hypothetical protein [Candidatus Photodesmus blepharus]|uniref:hypothetical protein n=1 Tax=Candidatus Photodesmus blepharonis TaxID=1179155 RepID=UPI0012DDD821|nr:hypothetical protein [Candidatus Photodesmus blepharus]